MSDLQDLMRLVPPPSEPVDGDGEWRWVWPSLGCRLPDDYQDLVRAYGLGNFADIVLWTPFTIQPWANLVVQARGLIDDFPDRDDDPSAFPYPLYPEPGGVLRWAADGQGGWLCWLTEGEPGDWPVVEWNIRQGARRHDVGAVEFLVGYLTGARDVMLLRPPPLVPWFDSYRERVGISATLIPGPGPTDDLCLRLRAEFGRTVGRGAHDGRSGHRQESFKALDQDWLVTYTRRAYGTRHNIWIGCPLADADDAKVALTAAATAIGCVARLN